MDSEYGPSFEICISSARRQGILSRNMLEKAPDALHGWWLFFRESSMLPLQPFPGQR